MEVVVSRTPSHYSVLLSEGDLQKDQAEGEENPKEGEGSCNAGG